MKRKEKIIEYIDRVFFIEKEVDDKHFSKNLEKRLYDNKNITLISKKDETIESLDEVTKSIQKDFSEIMETVETKKAFYELYFKDMQVNGFILDIASKNMYQRNKEVTFIDEDVYDKKTLRLRSKLNLIQLKEDQFDERYGIITNIYKYLGTHNISLVGCEFVHNKEVNFSYGREREFDAAETAALLELLERRAMYEVEGEKIYTSFEDGSEYNLINPKDFLYYDPVDSIVDPFDPKCKYTWLKVLDYKEKVYKYLPLQFFDLDCRGESIFVIESSNGVALGSSLQESRLFALLELVERDAFLNFWYKKVKVFEIDRSSIPEVTRKEIEDYETKGRKVYILDITFDIDIPTILCLVISETDSVSTYISTASHINPEVAIKNAVFECLVGHRVYSGNESIGKKTYSSDYDIVDMSDHVSHAAQKGYIKNYDFLMEGLEKKSMKELYKGFYDGEYDCFNNATELLDYLLYEKMKSQDNIYFADLTTELSYKNGFYVSKIVAPKMLSMTFGHRNRRINKERIELALAHSKYKNKSCLERGCINERVHSFP